MTPKDVQALEILVEMVKQNALTNEGAHQEIIKRLDKMTADVTTTFGKFTDHCAKREKIVDAALARREKEVDAEFKTHEKSVSNGFAALAPKKYTAYQVVRSMGKMAMLILAQAAVTVGILAAVGVFD